jgi:hypothetical protein
MGPGEGERLENGLIDRLCYMRHILKNRPYRYLPLGPGSARRGEGFNVILSPPG